MTLSKKSILSSLHKTNLKRNFKTLHLKMLQDLLSMIFKPELEKISTKVKSDGNSINIPINILNSNLPIPFESTLEIVIKFKDVSHRVEELTKKIAERLDIVQINKKPADNKMLNIELNRGAFKKVIELIEELEEDSSYKH